MTPTTRTASGLLAVFPVMLSIQGVMAAIGSGWAGYLLQGLPLALFLSVVSVQLWRGRGWAYAAAIVCSALLPAVLVLYTVASAYIWGAAFWEGMTPLHFLLPLIPIAAPAAAFYLLVREETFALHRRRGLALLALALAVELVLMALIARVGVGGFSGHGYQDALRLSQLPGETILGQMGMCCGYENETIISDVIDPHFGGITRGGIPTLIAANALGLAGILSILRIVLLLPRAVRASGGHAAEPG